ncbi:adenosylcobinamide-GDP ribazoletransferase [Litoreibacter arenae]|uniref:Adenosylcobinamide-GDP ribazoletransferase n=1 Tax=Litoreibacter arenae DSM 19593 TaxID=1123360 RepID=S9RP62_9RHOB|nr:adenosylcobinamide-GDP ribazoletransferase [Litoreibacter arenae]EPX79880.1 Cobalamin synthase [Litoreibacter arenae DSM 19593]
MDNNDTALVRLEDVWVALGLLTRLPLPPRDWDETRPAARAAWAYPLAGLIVATLSCLLASVLLWLGLPATVTAAATLMALTLLTGAMHEDGLADTADGLWGGPTPARRLEIMKDSHIGAYGVIALISGFALRWSALSALIAAGWLWTPVLVAAILSRTAMAYVMDILPNARSSGLSKLTGRPGKQATRIAAGLSVVAAFVAFGFAGFWLVLVAALTLLTCATIAKRKIGGQTGDILGATQCLTEIALLVAISALVL